MVRVPCEWTGCHGRMLTLALLISLRSWACTKWWEVVKVAWVHDFSARRGLGWMTSPGTMLMLRGKGNYFHI